MRRQHTHRGYVNAGPGDEADIVGCGHCQAQIETQPGISCPVPMCRACVRFLCDPCNKALQTGTCVTWERKFERMERRAAFLRQISDGGSSK